jgi:hypothetical protein
MHKTTRQAIQETIRQAIDDLYALAREADSEDTERIYEIIERLKRFNSTWGKSPGVQAVAERSLTRSGR